MPKYLPTRPWLLETRQFLDRINANGGSIQAASLEAVDIFVRACQSAGIWSKFYDVGVFVGNDLTSALVKLVVGPGGQQTLTNMNFVSGDYTETGATGGLSSVGSKFLNTGVALTALPDAAHLSFYLQEDVSAAGNRSMIGALTATDQFWIGGLNPASTADFRWGAVATASTAGGLVKGFYTGVRESVSSLKLYRDGALANSNSTTITVTRPALNAYVFGWNSQGAAAASLVGRGSFYSMGSNLDATEVMALKNAVVALQTALGRNV